MTVYKDPNEALCAGVTAEQMRAAVSRATIVKPERLKSAYDFEQEIWDKFFPKGREQLGLTLPWGNSHGSVMPFRFRYGEVTVWSGFNGHGKSQVLNYVMVCLAAQGERGLIVSLEMQAPDTYHRIVRMATGLRKPVPEEQRNAFRDKCLMWINDKIWVYDHVGTAELDEVLKVCLYARKRYGVRQFIFDSLMRFVMAAGDDQYEEQKVFMDKLVDFAQRWQCHVHLVAHSKKLKSEHEIPRKYDIAGSAAISNLAFNVIIVWRNKDKEQEVNEILQKKPTIGELPEEDQKRLRELYYVKDAFFLVDKQRGGEGDEPVRDLWFEKGSLQFHEAANQQPITFITEKAA